MITTQESNKKDMAIWRDKIKDDFKLATELLEGKIQAVEQRITEKLDRKLDKSYFIEYMDGFKASILKNKK